MCSGILYWAKHKWWTTCLQTISYASHEILSSGFLLMQYFCLVTLWHFGVTFELCLWHFWHISCAHSCTDRKTSQFLFQKYFSSTKSNWWHKNLLTWFNKEADFFFLKSKKFHFPWNGPKNKQTNNNNNNLELVLLTLHRFISVILSKNSWSIIQIN